MQAAAAFALEDAQALGHGGNLRVSLEDRLRGGGLSGEESTGATQEDGSEKFHEV